MAIDKREFLESLETDSDFRRSVVTALTRDIDTAERLSEVSMQETLQGLNNTLQTLINTVGRLSGAEFEWESNRRLPVRLEETLEMRDIRILRSRGLQTAEGQRLSQVVSRSELLPEQRRRIGETDMIAIGEIVATGERVYVAVELSTTIRMRDITRARDTAIYLQTVFGRNARAVVSGYAIRDEDQQRADDNDVEVILLESE